jgi:hypothetical protein
MKLELRWQLTLFATIIKFGHITLQRKSSLVDRNARDHAAQLLRNFISGKISNDDFDDGCPTTKDPAIDAIWSTAWVLYDDMNTHNLIGRHRLTADMRRICVRWILFLQSDFDYQWPDISLPGIDPATRMQKGFFRRLFGIASDTLDADEAKHFLSAGHYPVWPFISAADYRNALRKPKLLSGGNVRAR